MQADRFYSMPQKNVDIDAAGAFVEPSRMSVRDDQHDLPLFRLLHVTTVPMTLRFLYGQVRYMISQGIHVEVASSPGSELNNFGLTEGVPVAAIKMARRIAPIADMTALARIYYYLGRRRPTIVHAHTPKGGLLAMIGAFAARVPVRIYHIHGLPFLTASGVKRIILRWTERISCYFASQVLCVSRSVRDVAIAEGLCPEGKIKVLAGGTINGIAARRRFDPSTLSPSVRSEVRARYGIPDDALVIGFIGRLVRDKGVEELETAWSSLRGDKADLHLLLVGPFEPQDPVPPGIRARLEGDPRVHLVGMDWETPQYYAAMDLVVLPTYREGFPTVPLEAAAMELPVVATRIPGCVDAVDDGITGTLVPVKDVDALTAAIRRYVDDSELRRRHGLAGRVRVLRDFRQEVIWEAMYQEYRRLLADRGIAVPDQQHATASARAVP